MVWNQMRQIVREILSWKDPCGGVAQGGEPEYKILVQPERKKEDHEQTREKPISKTSCMVLF
jgi:hypothetical protein